MCCAAFPPFCPDRFLCARSWTSCALARLLSVIHCHSARAPRRQLTGWPQPKTRSAFEYLWWFPMGKKQMILAFFFRLAQSHLPNLPKCKHAGMFLHVFSELGSKVSFAIFKEIKILIFSTIQDRCVPNSLIHHESEFTFAFGMDRKYKLCLCVKVISATVRKITYRELIIFKRLTCTNITSTEYAV